MTGLPDRFMNRRGTASNLATVNEVPLDGELIVEKDTLRFKFGDGAASYNSLPYASDGDCINVKKHFRAKGDGVTDDTAAIALALASSNTEIYFPQGRYRITDSLLDGTPILTSAVAGRRIHGPGILTVTSTAKVALAITGDNTSVSLEVDGANKLGIAISVSADNCLIDGCFIHDLNGFTNYSAIGVRVQFASNDYTIRITNNRFENFQAVGDGVGGNGSGMTRAVAMSATANLTRKSVVSGNKCWKIEGEEGDALQVISSNGAGTYYDWPVEFVNNDVDLFTRRGVKIQANKVKVHRNTFSNNRAVDPGNLQGVIDVTQGGDAVITENTLTDCKFSPQIKQFESTGVFNRLIIARNVITGVGTETSSSIITISNSGTGHQVVGNIINCATYTGTAIFAPSAVNLLIAGNTISVNNTVLYNLTSATGTRIVGNLSPADLDRGRQSYFDEGKSAFVFDVSAGRNLILRDRDTVVSDGEVVARLSCEQNDDSAPSTVNASIQFVGEGSTGALGIDFATGTNTPRVRITTGGVLRPTTSDNTQDIGSTTIRWRYIHAFNVRTHGVTVATLPAAATAGAGARAFVTDANATTFAAIVAGGGANGVPVYSDGTNWRIG